MNTISDRKYVASNVDTVATYIPVFENQIYNVLIMSINKTNETHLKRLLFSM